VRLVGQLHGSCYRCHKHLANIGKEVDSDMALQIEVHLDFKESEVSKLIEAAPEGLYYFRRSLRELLRRRAPYLPD
jgi:hypothetical protein